MSFKKAHTSGVEHILSEPVYSARTCGEHSVTMSPIYYCPGEVPASEAFDNHSNESHHNAFTDATTKCTECLSCIGYFARREGDISEAGPDPKCGAVESIK